MKCLPHSGLNKASHSQGMAGVHLCFLSAPGSLGSLTVESLLCLAALKVVPFSWSTCTVFGLTCSGREGHPQGSCFFSTVDFCQLEFPDGS